MNIRIGRVANGFLVIDDQQCETEAMVATTAKELADIIEGMAEAAEEVARRKEDEKYPDDNSTYEGTPL